MAYFVIFLDKIKGFGFVSLSQEKEKTDTRIRHFLKKILDPLSVY